MHVLTARVRPVDPPRVGGGVPLVDRRIELHAGVGALPGSVGDLTEEVAGRQGIDDGAVHTGHQVPVAPVDHCLHELVGHPDRVVGVLVLRGVAVGPVEVHVEAGIAQHPCFALFDRLAPDEVGDIRVVDIEDDHFGRPPSLAPRLDGPAFEDGSLFGVPVEDRVHLVLHRQDEARRGLLGNPAHPDVEPDRRVERRLLVDDEVLQLGIEDLGLNVVDEVAVLDPPRSDGVDHPVGHLLERPLPLFGPEGPPEVLLGQDVGGVEAPGFRDLDSQLFEGNEPVPVVGDPRIAAFPAHLVVGVHTLGGEVAADADSDALGGDGHGPCTPLVRSSGPGGSHGRPTREIIGLGEDQTALQPQYIVVGSLPRHEILGSLQHCSYVPVNGCRETSSLVAGRSRRFAFWAWSAPRCGDR